MQKETEYQNIKDEDLIEQLRCGQEEITDYIMDKYKNLVRKRANAMFLMGGDTDDLIQEGMIGLFKAIRDFQMERDVSFYRFADLCITRQIYHAVEASQRKKHQPLNTYVSLNAEMGQEGEGTLLDILESFENANPEQLLIDQENTRAVQEKLKKNLSSFEQQVLQLYFRGMNYRQIAEELEEDVERIREMIKKMQG